MSAHLQAELAMFRMHNSSLAAVYEGHMIKATVLEVGGMGLGGANHS